MTVPNHSGRQDDRQTSGTWTLGAPSTLPDRGSFLALKYLREHVLHAEHLLPSWNLGSCTCQAEKGPHDQSQ